MSVKHMAQETAIFSRWYRKTAPNKVNRIAGEVKTEMDLVERVARRILESRSLMPWDRASNLDLGLARHNARAAIAEVLDAMEQPSAEAVFQGSRYTGLPSEETQEMTDDIWQAMLAQFKAENVK